jgi:hypothetical protein
MSCGQRPTPPGRGDYAEHREVLDTMMETLRFDR